MELDKAGSDFIKRLESGSTKPQLQVYRDAAGLPTIGFGHKLTAEEIATNAFQAGITAQQAQDLFAADLEPAENAVNTLVTVALTQPQYDALVSFVYNVGAEAFGGSQLLRLVNEGQLQAVPAELLKWQFFTDPKTKRKVASAGLLKRRKAEAALWESPEVPQPPVEVAEAEQAEAVREAPARPVRRRRPRLRLVPLSEGPMPSVPASAPEPTPMPMPENADALLRELAAAFFRGLAKGMGGSEL